MFIDKVTIHIKSGNGGNGAVSFRREKYVSHGGPDGGDGGRGGNIIFRIDEGTNTLLSFRYHRKFVATDGENGKGAKVRVYKMKPKKGYRRTQGHRQPYTKVQIEAINA